MEPWTFDINLVAAVVVAVAVFLLLLLFSFIIYEYRKHRKGQHRDVESGVNGIGVLKDAQKGVPATVRLVQTLAKMHSRILDDINDGLLASTSETLANIDRYDHLSISSADFDRYYAAALSKYKQSDTVRGLIFSFTIESIRSGGFLQNSINEPFAIAMLTGSDGQLKLYPSHDCRHFMLSVDWNFNRITGATARNSNWQLFGRIHNANGRSKYELKLATDKKKPWIKYGLFPYGDDEQELLRIKGRPRVVTWAASQAGMSKTALVFKVYAQAHQGDRKVQIATIEPAIDSGAIMENSDSGHLTEDENKHKSNGKHFSRMLAGSHGDQLYSIKYNKSYVIDAETKSAILGAAFLLCLRHYMKDLYRIFHRTSLGKK